jgi:hypothetical protein
LQFAWTQDFCQCPPISRHGPHATLQRPIPPPPPPPPPVPPPLPISPEVWQRKAHSGSPAHRLMHSPLVSTTAGDTPEGRRALRRRKFDPVNGLREATAYSAVNPGMLIPYVLLMTQFGQRIVVSRSAKTAVHCTHERAHYHSGRNRSRIQRCGHAHGLLNTASESG